MASIRLLQTSAAATAGALIVLAATAPSPALAGSSPGATPGGGPVSAEPARSHTPRPPRIPRDFRGRGRYIVRDLGVNVPFTWTGRDGDSQMVAGGARHPIWFTNLIYRDTLYTLTYKWPNIPLNSHPCSRIAGFSRGVFNRFLSTSHFVGREILQGRGRRYVNHWRVSAVGGDTTPGEVFRFPIGQADFYVARGDRTRIWQVLHFGFQNLFDPDLDEWIRMRSFRHRPGKVALPPRCPPPAS
jgi:hypothetical protein